MEQAHWLKLRELSRAISRLERSVFALTWEVHDDEFAAEVHQKIAALREAIKEAIKLADLILIPQPGFSPKQWLVALLVEIAELESLVGRAAEIKPRDRIREIHSTIEARGDWIIEQIWLDQPEMTDSESAAFKEEVEAQRQRGRPSETERDIELWNDWNQTPRPYKTKKDAAYAKQMEPAAYSAAIKRGRLAVQKNSNGAQIKTKRKSTRKKSQR